MSDPVFLADKFRDFAEALQATAKKAGMRGLSESFDRSYSMIANCANPNLPNFQFTALQLAEIVSRAGSPEVAQQLAALTGHVVLPGRMLMAMFPQQGEKLAMAVLRGEMQASSRTGGVLAEAFDDHRIEAHELAEIEDAIDAQIKMLQGIRAACRRVVK